MDEQQNIRIRSARIIQRAFRIYLRKKRNSRHNRISKITSLRNLIPQSIIEEEDVEIQVTNPVEEISEFDENFDEQMIEKDIHQLQLFTSRIIDEVNSFYNKHNSNVKKAKTLNQMCDQINDISLRLMSVAKLSDIKEVDAQSSGVSGNVLEKAKKGHKEAAKKSKSKR